MNTLTITVKGDLKSYRKTITGIKIVMEGARLPKRFKSLKHVLETILKIIKKYVKKGLRIRCNELAFIRTQARKRGMVELERVLDGLVKGKTKRKKFTRKQRLEMFVRDDGRCQCCGHDFLQDIDDHIDHVVPLKKGGSNSPFNLQLLCATCNLKKGAK